MPQCRRKFNRPLGERRYRKLFVISSEGTKTEPRYFELVNQSINSGVLVKTIKDRRYDSSPSQVLKRMKEYLKNESTQGPYEAWLVVDKDRWQDRQLDELLRWSRQKDHYGLALSNPAFEYWLLLHFEDGDNIRSSRECSERLKRHLPGYDKGIDARKITRERIEAAIERAQKRDTPPCDDWPRHTGSTVYRLVANIRKD
jgi:hypothetical protein